MAAPTKKLDEGMLQFATMRQAMYLRAINEHGSMRAAAEKLGVGHTSLSHSIKALKVKAAGMTKRKAALMGYSPEHDMTRTVPEGFNVKGVSTYYNKDGKPSGQWVKSQRDNDQAEQIMRDFIESLVEDIRGKAPVTAPPAHCNDDLLCVYPMGDPHFGMYAWAQETGADFDVDIAERLTTGAIDRLVESAPAAGTAIILPLGDFFHADDSTSRTRSGHALDTDTRWAKVMQVGLRAMLHCVRAALRKHARVIVRIVKGNHDPHASLGLALAVDAYFHGEPRVEVDLTANAFWYFRFGRVLIGSTHGDEAKPADMPGIMAYDRAEDWGQTTHRYWYLGHVHHQTLKEYPGVIVEQFRTLAARDAWHSGMGYRAGRDMCLIIHHRTMGEIERHRVDVATIEGG